MSDQSKPATSQKTTRCTADLEAIVTALVAHYGWEQLGQQINIRCFTDDPSVKSSLKFLRKTLGAREGREPLSLRSAQTGQTEGRPQWRLRLPTPTRSRPRDRLRQRQVQQHL